jgi:hypothetical protein
LSIAAPRGWTALASDTSVTSGPAAFNGDLIGNVSWTDPTSGVKRSETTAEKVRNVSPIKINEFSTQTKGSFIKVYNADANTVDLSNWTLTEHPTQQAIFSSVKIPAGTKLAAHGFYLLGLSNSGLAAPAHAGDSSINVQSTACMTVGDSVGIDAGSSVETRKIVSIGTAASSNTTLWRPVPDGPIITIPAGSTNLPVTRTAGLSWPEDCPWLRRHLPRRREGHGAVRGGSRHRSWQARHAGLPWGGRACRLDPDRGDIRRQHLDR